MASARNTIKSDSKVLIRLRMPVSEPKQRSISRWISTLESLLMRCVVFAYYAMLIISTIVYGFRE